MKRRVLSVLLAAALLVNTQAFSALAKDSQTEMEPVQNVQETGEESEKPETEDEGTKENGTVTGEETMVTGPTITVDDEELPDSEELLEGYFQQQTMEELYGDGGISTYGSYGVEKLSESDRKLYDALKGEIEKVAKGGIESTSFTFTAKELGMDKPLTADDLGVSSLDTEEAQEKLMAHWLGRMETIHDLLLVNTPYEMFWYDKTKTGGMSYGMSMSFSTDTISAAEITIMFAVAQEYADSDESNPYGVDKAKVASVQTAAKNAADIVERHAYDSDYYKLRAYCEEICGLVTYNYEAANNSSTPYGNPWQLIWVFDGDTSTNVVCEGYSKAFQYLCDLSEFRQEGVTCYAVTGGIPEAHMWNIVSIGGKNYLADVTNSDSLGMDKLFLCGVTGSVADGYSPKKHSSLRFMYDSDTRELYSEDILTLSDEEYKETLSGVQIQTVEGNTELKEGYNAGPHFVCLPEGVSDTAGVTYQWLKDGVEIPGATSYEYQVPAGLTEGNYEYTCAATLDGSTFQLSVSVQVTKTSIADAEVPSPAMIYNGTDQSLQLTVKVGDQTLVEGTDYTVEPASVRDAGDYSVTLTGTGIYKDEKVVSITVSKKEVTPTVTGNLDKKYDGSTAVADTFVLGLEGVCDGDDVHVNAGAVAYDSSDAGERTLGIKDIQIVGDKAGNYELTTKEVTETAEITPAEFDYNISEQPVEIGSGMDSISRPEDAAGVNGEAVKGSLKWYTDSDCETEVTTFSGQDDEEQILYWVFTPASGQTNYVKEPLKGSTKFTLKTKLNSVNITTDSDTNLTYGYGDAPILSAEETLLSGGDGTVQYQWMLEEEELDGASEKTYQIPARLPAGTYSYTCKVTSGDIEAVSEPLVITVQQMSIHDAQVAVDDLTYNGKNQTPKVTVTLDGQTLASEEYEVSYAPESIRNKGTYNVTVSGCGNYKDSVSAGFKVLAKDLTPSLKGKTSKVYDGTVDGPTGLEIALEGICDGDVVKATGSVVYDLADAGERVLRATNISLSGDAADNYILTVNSAEASGTIQRKNISGAEITLGDDLVYNGHEQVQEVTGVVLDAKSVTYDVTGNKATNAGAYTLKVAGTGNYTGDIEKEFTIAPAKFAYTVSDQPVKIGSSVESILRKADAVGVNEESVKGSLKWYEDSDYRTEVTSFSGQDGQTKVLYWVFTPENGQSNYVKEALKGQTTFTLKTKLNDVILTSDATQELTFGYENGITLTAEAKLLQGGTGTVTYQWLVNGEPIEGASGTTYQIPAGLSAGTYNYVCQVTTADLVVASEPLAVTVQPLSIANAEITAEDMTYNGQDQTPALTVNVNGDELIGDTDYTTTYVPGTLHDAGEYTITVKGQGNYTGSAEKKVSILQKEVEAYIAGSTAKVYDGTANAPEGIQVGLNGVCDGDDVTASGTAAYDGADAGDRALKVTSITLAGEKAGNYRLLKDTLQTTARIEPKDMSQATITLGAQLIYTGKQQVQNIASVTFGDWNLTYNVTDNQAVSVGTYQLKVSGTGNFSGTATKEYTVAPASFTYAVSDQTVKIGNGLDTVNVASQASGVSGEMVDGTLTWFADEGRTQELQNYVFEGSAGSQTTLYWRFTPAAGQTNYKSDSVEGSATFTLQEKAVPVLEVKDYVKDYDGKEVKLSDVVSGVSAKVDGAPVNGTWQWDVNGSIVKAGKYQATVKFIPDDSKNLASASTVIQVTINQLPMKISMVVATTEIQVFRQLPEVRLVYNGKTAEGESLISSVGTLFKWTNSNTNVSGSTVVSLANTENIRADVEKRAAGNYNITWELSPITVTIKAIETPVSGLDETKYTVKVDGLKEAELEALPEKYQTEEAVSDELMDTAKEMLKKGDDVFKHAIAKPQSGWKAEIQGSLLFSAELMKKEDGQSWESVDAEEFPTTGISFKVAYPAGTSKATHAFAAIHMITENIDGNEPGDTELLKITLENDGIVIHMNSCSPVLLVWSEAPKAAAQTDVTKPSDNKTDAANTTNTANATKTTGNKAAQTGDTANTALYLFLLVLSVGGATAAVWSKKRHKA